MAKASTGSMDLSNVQIRRGLSVRASPRGWCSPERLLEGAGKSGLGTVPDQVGNLRKGRAGIAELLGRDLHAPTGDIVHRRHADQTNEAVGQRRTRQADLTAKVIHVPRPGNVAMEQRQRPRYVGVAQTGEPTGLPLRQCLSVASHGFNEQQLRQLRQYGLRTWAASGDLLGGILESRADPFCCPALLGIEF